MPTALKTSELSATFRVDAGPVFKMLRRLGMCVDPALLMSIVYEEGQAFVVRAREMLLSRDYGKHEQYVTGELYDNIKFDVSPGRRIGRIVGKFWVDCPYAVAVEFKTPRRINPPTLAEIVAWKKAKVGYEGIEGGIMAWNYIQKHGVRNHPFFFPSYRLMKNIVLFRIGQRILAIMQDPKGKGLISSTRLRVLSRKHTSINATMRTFLYKWARILGWMHAMGIDVSAIRAFMYTAARGIGDATAIESSAMLGRLMRRSAGGVTTMGISAGVPNSDPLVNRAMRVSAGRLTGPGLRGISVRR